jgi:hypothetical protein
MARTNTVLLLALGSAALAVGSHGAGATPTLTATSPSVLADTDGDFLPDVVEWVVLTSAANPDTDGDGVLDFVEVVERGAPRDPSEPIPLDHQMRVVVTAPPVGSPDQTSWLHLLVRFATSTPPSGPFAVWFETSWAPGLRLPLESLFAGAILEVRTTPHQGTWLSASVPLVSAAMLQALLPCGIYAEAAIDGALLRTGVKLLDLQGTISCLVPFGSKERDRFAFQSIAPPLVLGSSTNKVCVLDLNEVGSGPGGSVFEVVAADCEDCNELECGVGCAQSVGWILTIPGGLAALGH